MKHLLIVLKGCCQGICAFMAPGSEGLQMLLIDKLIDLIMGDNQMMPFLLTSVSHDKHTSVGTALFGIITIACGFQGRISNVVHLCVNDVAGEVAYCQQHIIIKKFPEAAGIVMLYFANEACFDCLPVLAL